MLERIRSMESSNGPLGVELAVAWRSVGLSRNRAAPVRNHRLRQEWGRELVWVLVLVRVLVRRRRQRRLHEGRLGSPAKLHQRGGRRRYRLLLLLVVVVVLLLLLLLVPGVTGRLLGLARLALDVQVPVLVRVHVLVLVHVDLLLLGRLPLGLPALGLLGLESGEVPRALAPLQLSGEDPGASAAAATVEVARAVPHLGAQAFGRDHDLLLGDRRPAALLHDRVEGHDVNIFHFEGEELHLAVRYLEHHLAGRQHVGKAQRRQLHGLRRGACAVDVLRGRKLGQTTLGGLAPRGGKEEGGEESRMGGVSARLDAGGSKRGGAGVEPMLTWSFWASRGRCRSGRARRGSGGCRSISRW